MNPAIKKASEELEQLLAASPITKGLVLRVRGSHLTLSRDVTAPDGEVERDDRVRLSHLGNTRFGLSVFRHTGKWEKTPFAGSLNEMVDAICGTMQHIVADWP